MISHYDLEYKKNLFIDLHLPEEDSFDLFVYFHGGGLTAGNSQGRFRLRGHLLLRATESLQIRGRLRTEG